MPSKNAKQRELDTYRKLRLGREAKSFRRRESAADAGLFRYIGEGTAERPYFRVLKREYERVWKEEWEKIRGAWTADIRGAEAHLSRQADLCRVKAERLVYDRLSAQQEDLRRLADAFERKQGRRPTPHEMECFGKTVAPKASRPSNSERAAVHRKRWIGEVLTEIHAKHQHHGGRLQQAWATVVGSDIAMEVLLEKVDAATGVAVCRCLSASRAHQLRLQRDLPAQLARELGMRITRILFR